MPLNEAEGFQVHSNLTEEQQREAEKAIYGLAERAPMTPEALTYEDRVRMRRLLDQLDQKEQAGTKDFDLNKPPVAPYVYREFPFLMYHHATKATRPARNNEERNSMLAEGWSVHPFASSEQPEIPLTAAEQAEAEEIDSKLTKRKK